MLSPLPNPLARALSVLLLHLPLRFHLLDGKLALLVILLLDAPEDGRVLALNAVELFLTLDDVQALVLTRRCLSAL